jgi:butyrate kinase
MEKQIEHEIEMAKADLAQLSKEDLVDELLQTQLENNKLRKEKIKRTKEITRLNKIIDNLNNRNDIYRKHLKELGVDVDAYDTKYDHLL